MAPPIGVGQAIWQWVARCTMSAERKREQETEVERGRRRGGSAIERNPKNQTDLYTSCGSVVMAPDGKRFEARMRGAIYLIRCIKLIKIRAASYQLPRRVSQARARLGGAGLPSCSSARINKCAKVQATLPPYPVPPTPQSPSVLPACSSQLAHKSNLSCWKKRKKLPTGEQELLCSLGSQ